MPDNLLETLNKEQLESVTHVNGPLMIIAGAGTGKTTVVTQRIAWLIEQGHAKPDQILALTFTEKAATEMEERVDRLLPMGYVDLWISTFHAFCERILREHAIDIGLPHEFKLLNEVDALLMMRRHFDRFELKYYAPKGNPTRFIKALLQHFSRLKDELVTPDLYIEFALKQQEIFDSKIDAEENEDEETENARILEVANAYKTYQDILLEQSAFDFADLISYTIELLKKRPNILKKFQNHFQYILVDEFQDTNRAQYELVKLLVKPKNNITVVGDDDQSIYKFRGASLSNILKFKTDFPDAKSVVLTHNYRSTKEVLNAAYKLIQQNNPDRLEIQQNINKKLLSHLDEEGHVEHHHFETINDEVKETVEKILALKSEKKCSWSDFCILVRANDSAEPFTSFMDRVGVPYKFMAMSGLYTKPLILDALAWMNIIIQPHNSPAMYRVLSHPKLGIPEIAISELTLFSRRKTMSLINVMKHSHDLIHVTENDKKRIEEILNTLEQLQVKSRRLPVNELFVEIIKDTGLLANIALLKESEQVEQFSFLKQFYHRLKKFEATNDDRTLYHFMSEFDHERDAGEVGSLSTDAEAGPDVVQIMTIHGSKGLEYKYVFMVNMVEQRFPSQRRSEAIPIPTEFLNEVLSGSDQHIAEERRLFYVGLTRAKKGVFLMSANDYGGSRKRKLSRFVSELDIQPINSLSSFGVEEEVAHVSKTIPEQTLPNTFSFTQIAAFSTCPLQYKFAHILKVPVFGRHSLSFGKTMHNTLHRFMTEVQNSKEMQEIIIPNKDTLLEMYNEQWIDEWYPDEKTKEEYREKGIKSLLEYRDQMDKKPPTVHSLEAGFTLKIAGVTMRGRIDRIDIIEGGVEIIDYKTGSPKEKLSFEDKRQLILYKLAAETCFDPPLIVKKLTFHYLEDNSTVSFNATQKDIEKLENQISSVMDAISESDFSPTPGFHCQYCDFKDICEFAKE